MLALAMLTFFLPLEDYDWAPFKQAYPNTFERIADDYENHTRIPFVIPIYPIARLTSSQKLPLKILPIIASKTNSGDPIRGRASSYRYVLYPQSAGTLEIIDEENLIFHPTVTTRTIVRLTVFAESERVIVGQIHFIVREQP